jgi:NAD(P)-dependent dehydrogenase (short-subunit alcohol dehydrogenase family)
MMAPKELQGRGALITGGGSGIGRGAALALAGAGAAVAVADLDPQAAAETVALVEREGGRAVAIAMDVTDPASVDQGFAIARQVLGAVDILVNSAGGNEHSPGGNATLAMDLDSWDRVIRLNLYGSLYTSRAAAAAMVERRWGRIVIVGSAAGYRLGAGGGAYAVSKAAVAAFAKILAREVGPHNVTVNSVAPFFVDTPMLRRQFPTEDAMAKVMKEGPLANPMGVVLQVEDQVAAILYLCQESGRYVTGQALHVNGGAIMP